MSIGRQQRRRDERSVCKEDQQAATEERMAERQSLLEALETVPGRSPSPAAKLSPYSPYVYRRIQKCIRDVPVIEELHDELRSHPGVPSKLRVSTMFHGMLTANWESHTFLRTHVALALTRMPKDFKEELRLPDRLTYPTYFKQQRRLEELLRETWSLFDFSGHLNQLEEEFMEASVPHEAAAQIEVIAIDESAFIGWHLPENFDVQKEVNKLVGQRYREIHGLSPRARVPKMSSPEMREIAADIGFPLGEDGRLERTTKDPDTRSGKKSATSKDASKLFSGYSTHKGVSGSSFTVSRNTDKLTIRESVGSYVLASHLVPANVDCGPIGFEMYRRAGKIAKNAKHVIADGGFTDKEKNFSVAVIAEEMNLHRGYHLDYVHDFDVVQFEHERGIENVIESCGDLYHRWMPKHLWPVPKGLTREELQKFQASRESWRFDDSESLGGGSRRERCPFLVGKIYNEALPHSVRSRRSGAKRVAIPEGKTQCCKQCTFIARADRLAKRQYPRFGTAAYFTLMPTRNPVEGKFGEIKNKHGLISTSCRSKHNEPHALASLVVDVVQNLQKTINQEIKELLAHQKAKRARKTEAASRKKPQAPNDGREMVEPDGRDSADEAAPEDSDDESSAETPIPPRAPP